MMFHKKLHNVGGVVSLAGLLLFSITPTAYAASLTFTPSSGTFDTNSTFTVDLVIDGQSEAFNAAEATIVSSSNLNITDVVLGDCGFSFVKTPTISNLSYTGVLLGTSQKKCSVYTLTVQPTIAGTATLTIQNASVKKFNNAAEILQAKNSGSYAITGKTVTVATNNTTSQASQQTQPNQPIESYTVTVKVLSDTNEPLREAEVVLDLGATNESNTSSPPSDKITVKTDQNGVANIPDVTGGVHTLTATYKGKPIVKNIVTVSGSQPTLVLSVKAQKQQQNPFLIGAIGVGIIIFISVLLKYRQRILKLFERNKPSIQQINQ